MKERKRQVHLGRPQEQQRLVTIISSAQYAKGSESVLLSRILNREDSERISENAILFTSLLANLTPSLSSVNKMAGMRIGRHSTPLLVATGTTCFTKNL